MRRACFAFFFALLASVHSGTNDLAASNLMRPV